MLAREKAALGFYVTAHPLANSRPLLQACSTASTVELKLFKDSDGVVLGGMVSQFRTVTTRAGRRPGAKLGIVTLEDLEGSIEAIVFPDDLDKYRPLLKPDALVFLQGEVDKRRQEPSLRVREVIPAADAWKRFAEYVVLSLAGVAPDDDTMQRVLQVCKDHPGSHAVYLEVPTDEGFVATIQCDAELSVQIEQPFVEAARAILGPDGVTVRTSQRRAIPLPTWDMAVPAPKTNDRASKSPAQSQPEALQPTAP